MYNIYWLEINLLWRREKLKKVIIVAVGFIALQSFIFCAANASSSIGADVNTLKKTGVKVNAYNTPSNISIIEYDTYGAESGYYIDDAFGTTTKYDKNGNILSKYKSNQKGKTNVYDKYNKFVGYFQPVSKNKTVFYDKYGEPLGYFSTDADGLVKKYDMSGVQLNTYKNAK